MQINKFFSLKDSLESARQDIARLKNQQEKINSYQDVNLDDDLKVLQSVFPDTPDRFSLFSNISLLQDSNNLVIQNFSSPFSDDDDEKIGVNVRTVATIDGYKKLLSNYFFRTGKLATIDNIFYDVNTQDLNFTIYFHSKHIDKAQGFITKKDDNVFAQIQDIRKTIATLSLTPDAANTFTNQNSSENYPAKQNPFLN
jgi:cold shock CspA family protein